MWLPKLAVDSFDWIRWRQGDPSAVFGRIRENSLPVQKIRERAIGYYDGDRLSVRPKIGFKGVMFILDNDFAWFHLSNKEFNKVFNDNSKRT